jgi:hypothetical protein
MTAILEREAGWTSASLGGREPLVRTLGTEETAAVRRLAQRVRGVAPEDVTRGDFDDPAITALMDEVRERVDYGDGAVILSGLDIATLGEEDFARAVVGLSTHLGVLAPQSAKRDRIGYVRKEADNPTARGYQSDIELRPHTDFHEIVALASVAGAAEGGLSGLVSIAAVRDILAREDPDALAALAEGFPHDTTGEGLLSDGPIPVIAEVDGMVSGYAQALFTVTAAKTLGEEVPARLTRAMQAFGEITGRDDVIVEFLLEPGEIMFWHNFRVLHSRTNFRDDESHRRLILRLWINPERHVPLPPVYLSQRERFDRLHSAGQPAIVYTHTGIKV